MKKIITLFTLLLSITYFSQVVYTDVDPDQFLQSSSSDSYAVDFNNDLTLDILIYETQLDTNLSGFPISFTGSALSPFYSNEVIGKVLTLGTENVLIVDTISSGQMIDGSANYINTSTPSVFSGIGLRVLSSGAFATTIGEFEGDEDGYIGVQFYISGSTHYGWIRVAPSLDGTSCTVKDFAYESTPFVGILAGDMGNGFVGIEPLNDFSNITIQQINNEFTINGINGETHLLVYNLIGKKVVEKRLINNNVVKVDEVNSGIYLLKVVTENYEFIKKVYINN